MYNHKLQRYFNEHIHLPDAFFRMPQAFMNRLIKTGGQFFANAYNYVEPDAEHSHDIRQYSDKHFHVRAARAEGRICAVVEVPKPEMALHCRMIGVSLKTDGNNPIFRTAELAENGKYLLCGWTAEHIHLNIRAISQDPEEMLNAMFSELATAEVFNLSDIRDAC